MLWQLSCQSPVSGYAQYTLLSFRTVNKEDSRRKMTISDMSTDRMGQMEG